MKSLSFIVLFGMLCIGGAHASESSVGHGSDPIRFEFNDAKFEAISRLSQIHENIFPAGTDKTIEAWILKHSSSMADDISGTEHVWIRDRTANCASTQVKRYATIHLSYPTCRESMGGAFEPARILLQQAVHHFEVTDVGFAEEVSSLIYRVTVDESQEAWDSMWGLYLGSLSGTSPLISLPKRYMLNLVPQPNPSRPRGVAISGTMRFYFSEFGSNEYQEYTIVEAAYYPHSRRLVASTKNSEVTLIASLENLALTGELFFSSVGKAANVTIEKVP